MKHIDLVDELLAREQSPIRMTAASIGRIYQHWLQSGTASFGIISAYRNDRSPDPAENLAMNKSLTKQLAGKISGMGYGYTRVIGNTLECQERDPVTDQPVDYDLCPPEKLVPVKEISFFINGITRKELVTLARKFNQDAVVYMGPDSDGKGLLVTQGNKVVAKFTKFTPGAIGQFFTEVKGRPFSFASSTNSSGSMRIISTLFKDKKRKSDHEIWFKNGKLHPDVVSMWKRAKKARMQLAKRAIAENDPDLAKIVACPG